MTYRMPSFHNVSPLRYPGGKTRAREQLKKVFMDHYDWNSYQALLSPYFGGGSFEFYMQNELGYRLLVNDKFLPLTLFWDAVKYSKPELVQRLKEIKVDKETFVQFRQELSDDLDDCDEVDIAAKFFVINRCSFSGATLSGGYSQEAAEKRFTNSSIDRVAAMDLSYFRMGCSDGTEFIRLNNPRPTDFIFADPPYYLGTRSKLYGKNGDLHEDFDHQALASRLRRCKSWMLTYNDCPEIRELYQGYKIIPLEWSYGMNTSKKSSEIVILSIKEDIEV